MLDRLAAWRHKPALWAIPLAVVAVNLLALLIFQTAFAGRVDALRRSYDGQAERLEQLQEESARAGRFIATLEAQDNAGDVLFEDYFATEGERFTQVIREVKDLAREAGMDPKQFSYPRDQVESYGLTKRGLNFPVSGTYEQLRRFMNLLELTDQFVTLEQVQLGDVEGARGGTADPRLTVRLRLSTIFIDTEYIVPRVERESPEEGTVYEEGAAPEEGAVSGQPSSLDQTGQDQTGQDEAIEGEET